MSTTNDSPAIGFQQINTTITGPDLLVALSGDNGVVLAGVSDDPIGVSYSAGSLSGFGTAGEQVSVFMLRGGTLRRMTASGAITQGALVYRAASGKISATAVGRPLGYAAQAFSGNGSVGNVYCFGTPEPADPHKIADPGTAAAIPVTKSGVCSITTGASGETNTMAAPTFDGQTITLALDVDGGGDRVVTVASAFNSSGNTVITLNDAGDFIHFVSTRQAGVLRWAMILNSGCTLA